MTNNKKTYCNPLPIPNIGRGMACRKDKTIKDYREVSDPAVLYDGGKWYMFPSCNMAYVSSDLINWQFVDVKCRAKEFYAPAVAKYKGKYYICSTCQELFVSDSPLGEYKSLGEFRTTGGEKAVISDPALYAEEGKGLYLYWGCGGEGIFGAKLNEDDFTIIESPIRHLIKFDPSNKWERFGAYNQSVKTSWTEGCWMYSKNGIYYLIYSSAGTEFPSYAMGVYTSDHPLGEFCYQKINPILRGTDGYVKGAGHGCIVDGPNGTIWAFFTSSLGGYHRHERRIGMDRAFIDENGYLFVGTPSGRPKNSPLTTDKNECGWLPLTVYMETETSSEKEGREGLYAVDENSKSWWQPSDNDFEPYIKVDLYEAYEVYSARIVWREIGLDYDGGVLPGPIKYKIVGLIDGKEFPLLDMSENSDDLVCDYREFPISKVCSAVKLIITGTPAGIRAGIIDFTIFGKPL